MVGDVASRMPVHSQNRSVTASDRSVRFMQLSVYAVVVADSTARPGLVASSATQNVVVFPPLSTRARSPRGYSTPEPDASVLLSIWRMIWNTDPAGIVTPAPGSCQDAQRDAALRLDQRRDCGSGAWPWAVRDHLRQPD